MNSADPSEDKSLVGREDTSFCLLLLTEDNADDHSYLYSLESILRQKYSSYRLVILDNASVDKTASLTKRRLSDLQAPEKSRVRLYTSKQKLPLAHILYFGIKRFCQPEEVVLAMEAGDELVGESVLELLNGKYQQQGTFAVYYLSIYH